MPIPPGFERCPVCGEFNGSTQAKYLDWGSRIPDIARGHLSAEGQKALIELKRSRYEERDPERIISVTCLCHGMPCPGCKVNKIHRPISNSYYERTNIVEHWPWFTGLSRCPECKAKARNTGGT